MDFPRVLSFSILAQELHNNGKKTGSFPRNPAFNNRLTTLSSFRFSKQQLPCSHLSYQLPKQVCDGWTLNYKFQYPYFACKFTITRLLVIVFRLGHHTRIAYFSKCLSEYKTPCCVLVHETATYRCDVTRGCVIQF